jgi:hypothetical protein
LFVGNPTNKTVIGTAYMWELLIANNLDQSLWLTNQKYWAAATSSLLHSFLEVHNCVAPFTSHDKLHKFGAKKPFPELNQHILTFHNKFYCLESHTEHRWKWSYKDGMKWARIPKLHIKCHFKNVLISNLFE